MVTGHNSKSHICCDLDQSVRREVVLWRFDFCPRCSELSTLVVATLRSLHKGPFKNDVSREGEGGGYPKSDAVREVA